MPDLGYIPLEPLTAKKMLQTLKTMNALLSIRLNLHEDLPISLRNWKIANGRATFTFPSEFEFDVTIADEDPLRQLYFVDIRFLFKPAPEIPEGPIRNALQFRADEALLNSKIPGCAEFLRNFVLTHQITTLGRQAYTLARSTWTSAIRIEPIHRSLIVQYWAESPFPKSWLEIGINSETGKKRLLPGHVEVPFIKAKWKRYGVEVKDSELDLRLSDLNLEGILKRAIAAHILEILRAAKEKLQQSVESIRQVWKTESQTLRIELQESVDEPIDCSLKLRLGQFSPEITFTVEPVSGRLCLQPLTAISKRTEWGLGHLKNPLLEVHEKLDTYLCFDMLWRIERQANHSGWQQIRNLTFPDHTLKDWFRGEVRGYGYFRPAGWEDAKSTWLVAVTVNLEGEKWWVIEVYVFLNHYSIAHIKLTHE
jgi:mediator of RNA polymerase II transcription subunit 14